MTPYGRMTENLCARHVLLTQITRKSRVRDMLNYDDNPTEAEGLALVIPVRERRRNRSNRRGKVLFFWRLIHG